jgi:hypothetical protein
MAAPNASIPVINNDIELAENNTNRTAYAVVASSYDIEHLPSADITTVDISSDVIVIDAILI